MQLIKRQSGSSILDILYIVMAFGLVFLLLSGFTSERKKRIDDLRTRPQEVSLADRELADTYAKKSPPEVIPMGRYLATTALDGDEYTITPYFPGTGVVFAEMKKPGSWFSPDISFSGSAPYSFTGSVMKFGPVTGDMIFFPETGEPITFNSPAQFVLHSDRENLTFNRVDLKSDEPSASPSDSATSKPPKEGAQKAESSTGSTTSP